MNDGLGGSGVATIGGTEAASIIVLSGVGDWMGMGSDDDRFSSGCSAIVVRGSTEERRTESSAGTTAAATPERDRPVMGEDMSREVPGKRPVRNAA
jgi:hypothetical protein